MGYSLNRATILGNVGKKTEYRVTLSGHKICTFSIATSEKYKNREGELVESTEWHHIETWDKLADIANQNIRKGSKVLVEGKMKTETYDKDGITKHITKIIAMDFILLSNEISDKNFNHNTDLKTDELDLYK